MQCPHEIAQIVCEILRTGLLRIRNLDDIDRSLEADHLHNLPGLLADYNPDLLDYYWTVERTCFVDRCGPEASRQFEPMWESLAKYVVPGAKKAG